MKKDTRLSWGVTLLVFGILFLIKQFNVLSPEFAQYFYDARNYPIIAGIIFLICHSNKSIGWVLVIFGLLMRLFELVRFLPHWSVYVFPALLIVAGCILVFGVKKGK